MIIVLTDSIEWWQILFYNNEYKKKIGTITISSNIFKRMVLIPRKLYKFPKRHCDRHFFIVVDFPLRTTRSPPAESMKYTNKILTYINVIHVEYLYLYKEFSLLLRKLSNLRHSSERSVHNIDLLYSCCDFVCKNDRVNRINWITIRKQWIVWRATPFRLYYCIVHNIFEYFFYSFNIEPFHIQSSGHRTCSEEDVEALDFFYNPSSDTFMSGVTKHCR